MSAAPTVSVITACYNGARLIGETIDAVLAQSFGDFELIVVDDASTDDSLERLRSYVDPRVRIIASERNGGPIAARNRAFAAARGRYVAGLDHDDLCHPHRLAEQVRFLDAHPRCVLVASAVDVLREDGRIVPDRGTPAVTTPALIEWMMHFGNPLTWSSVMLRAATARSLDIFERPDRLFAEDFDLYHRMARRGDICRMDRPLLTYRRHGDGASQRHVAQMTRSAVQVLEDAYRPIFDEGAGKAAERMVHSLNGSRPVADLAQLQELEALIEAVHGHVLTRRALDEGDEALIAREHARMWWRVVRSAVRSGRIPSFHAFSAKPRVAPVLSAHGLDTLTSAAIGTVRGLQAHLGLRPS